MPSNTDLQRPPRGQDDNIDNYFVGDEFEDPFASPEPDAEKAKRKAPEGLGIDEEVSVKKRARAPRVKLDESRLLSENGIPKLRKKAHNLKLKGKGHEFSDAARLLSFYQLWLDDLFPKAKFLDALAMVEKAGHKTTMQKMRMEWINQGKPTSAVDDTFDPEEQQSTAADPTKIAPIFDQKSAERPKTPAIESLFDDEDMYNATPRARNSLSGGDASQFAGGEPEEDDLDALMAEAEAQHWGPPKATAPSMSIFGSTKAKLATVEPSGEPDEDDLDAFMAMAETNETSQDRGAPTTNTTTSGSIKGAIEAGVGAGDDLDALIAESETQSSSTKLAQTKSTGSRDAGSVTADDEEVMAEMEGLW